MSKAIASYQCPISGMFVTQRLINGSIEEFAADTPEQAEKFADQKASDHRRGRIGLAEELEDIENILNEDVA